MPWKIFEITTDIMASSMQSDGILRDAILVTAELSDFFADVFNLGQRSNVCWLLRKRANCNPRYSVNTQFQVTGLSRLEKRSASQRTSSAQPSWLRIRFASPFSLQMRLLLPD